VSISTADYKKRRARLMSMMSPGSVALIPGASPARRNRDIQYLFRQDSDFFYLTGFSEPDALLLLVPGREHGQEILFCAERDQHAERWDGERLGPERATQNLGVDDAFPVTDMDDILPGLLEGRERIYMTLGEYPEFDARLLAWVAEIRKREAGGSQPPGEFLDLKHLLHELRLFKSAKELQLMRKAADITTTAHRRAMQMCQPGMLESQLEAELTHEFMSNGARSPAYPCIVGSGENACVMHYVDNAAVLKKNDLVLIDAGCEYQHYAADVTRTFPVNGQFSTPQRRLYDIVLQANEAAIAQCRPGQHFNAPHEEAVRIMVEGLLALQLLEGDAEQIIASESYKTLCPHKTSHWLGIDVHDVGDYRIDSSWREFEAGMVLTIEPGIYIPRDDTTKHLPNAYRGIGIRIEDDVLITKGGCEVLSDGVPKQPDHIEQLMAQSWVQGAA
jgi:Xaa-Pro aminopeptidase